MCQTRGFWHTGPRSYGFQGVAPDEPRPELGQRLGTVKDVRCFDFSAEDCDDADRPVVRTWQVDARVLQINTPCGVRIRQVTGAGDGLSRCQRLTHPCPNLALIRPRCSNPAIRGSNRTLLAPANRRRDDFARREVDTGLAPPTLLDARNGKCEVNSHRDQDCGVHDAVLTPSLNLVAVDEKNWHRTSMLDRQLRHRSAV